jgi:hypothetical protein
MATTSARQLDFERVNQELTIEVVPNQAEPAKPNHPRLHQTRQNLQITKMVSSRNN